MEMTSRSQNAFSLQEAVSPELRPLALKVEAGERLTREDGIRLFRSQDLLGIGRLAQVVRRRLHGDRAYFVYNQHINYTNICINRCRFCAFARDPGQEGGFLLSPDQVEEKVRSRLHEPIQEIHIVGGLHPGLGLDYAVELLRRIRRLRPETALKAFTAVEVDHFARKEGCSAEEVLQELKKAGLSALPGGGAEVFSERLRHRLFPRKISAQRWLAIMEAAHSLGIPTNATLLYGHMETMEERVEHLLMLREQQDRSGGFMAFIPLAFHPKNTALSHLPRTSGWDDLKVIAAARLILDNIPHIKAYWVMIGPKLAQVALSFGADDLDGTVLEEKISHMAGAETAQGMTPAELHDLIGRAGFRSVQRDAFYGEVSGCLA